MTPTELARLFDLPAEAGLRAQAARAGHFGRRVRVRGTPVHPAPAIAALLRGDGPVLVDLSDWSEAHVARAMASTTGLIGQVAEDMSQATGSDGHGGSDMSQATGANGHGAGDMSQATGTKGHGESDMSLRTDADPLPLMLADRRGASDESQAGTGGSQGDSSQASAGEAATGASRGDGSQSGMGRSQGESSQASAGEAATGASRGDGSLASVGEAATGASRGDSAPAGELQGAELLANARDGAPGAEASGDPGWPEPGALRPGDRLVLQVDRSRLDAYFAYLVRLAAEAPEGLSVAPYCARAGGLMRLHLIAAARIALPKRVRVEARHDLLGIRLAQVALGFGADTLAGPLAATRKLPLAGVPRPDEATPAGLAALIERARLEPVLDDLSSETLP